MALIPRTVDISSVMRDCEFLDNIQDEFKTDDRTEGATHVVLGDKKKTLKVLFGIAKGLWMVHFDWVLKSLSAEKWLDEEKFEATKYFSGVKKSRLAHVNKEKGPLAGTSLYVHGKPELQKPNMLELIELCDGEIVTSLTECDVCICGNGVAPPKTGNDNNVPVVREEWLLETITQYEKQDPLKYPAPAL